MKARINMSRLLHLLGKTALGLFFLGAVVLLMVWLAGGFKEKISPATGRAPEEPLYTGASVTVRQIVLPRTEEAVGTVRPVSEMVVTSRIAARITELQLSAGQKIARDEVLVRLDDRDLKARVDQLKAVLASAQATFGQARSDRERFASAYANGVATKIEFDHADLAMKNAESDVTRASEAVKEAQATMEYTVIRAPASGVIVDKRVNIGDTVMPGQVLATMYDPARMQLVASVREALTQRLKIGQSIGVRMETLAGTFSGSISEIVPEAESASRTFQVKVTGSYPPGIYSGMFGRIVIPLDSQEIQVIPGGVVRHVGQLDLVDVLKDGRLERRIVRLGRQVDHDVEILSGLREGEQVAARNPASPSVLTSAPGEGR